MLEKDHGHIVSIASMAGHVGIPKLIDYCASKFAAVGFDEALRLELEMLGADGVHTTVICPYFIQATGMFDDVNSRYEDDSVNLNFKLIVLLQMFILDGSTLWIQTTLPTELSEL